MTASFLRSADDSPVAVSGHTVIDARALALAAAAIEARLRGTSGDTWGVYVESPILQLAVLTALQSLGRKAVLLPHVQPQFVAAIRAGFDGLLLDQPMSADGALHVPALKVLVEEGACLDPLICEWLEPVGLLTSGSSGEPTCSWKRPAEIVDEIQMIEKAFGAQVGRDRVLHGTTSHQHLFGFTFRVMWPFLTGRMFSDTQIRIPRDVSAAIRADDKIILISSPAFLARARRIFDFEQISASALVVFSSGGPLDTETAMLFNQGLNVALVEIYGSTETGALAHRLTVDHRDTPWRPLPGVDIEIDDDGFLTARAPHFNGHHRLRMADKGEPRSGGGFALRGRADQIVKVADKRVSLSELERRLHELPEVAEARVLQLDDLSLGAVVSPTESAWRDIRRLGKGTFTSRLRHHLSQHVDRVTTPKRWRLTKAIARNSQGKVELAALKNMFATPGDRRLAWETMELSATHWAGRTTVPPDLPELDGHFPGEPIVPGVAQLHWAATQARQYFDPICLSGQMVNVKFRSPILPGCTVTLTLRLDRNAGKVDFELGHGAHAYSSGRLLLELP